MMSDGSRFSACMHEGGNEMRVCPLSMTTVPPSYSNREKCGDGIPFKFEFFLYEKIIKI